MKIIQYIPYSYHIHTGGIEKIAETISCGLRDLYDFDTLIVASDIHRVNQSGIENVLPTLLIPSFDLVYNFPVPKFRSKDFWKSFQIIKNKHPDIIVTHTRFFIQSLIGGIIAKWLGCKRVHVEHGSGFVTGYPWYIKFCARLFDWTVGLWIFRQCDQIVTISQMHKQFISKFTEKEPLVIYNPVDFLPLPKILNNVVHIGFVGRLVSLKGVNVLIHALEAIQNSQWICTIVGDGDQKIGLQDLVYELGLQDRIKFVGADDRAHRLHQFDIFVNPSYQEGLPTTVVEALMAKSIVVATDVGGTREISDKDDLILIKSGSVSELVVGLKKVFEKLDKSGLSYNSVMQKFGVEHSIKKYREVMF